MGLMGLTDSETVRLFKELGAISSKIDGLQAGQDAHEKLDIVRMSHVDREHESMRREFEQRLSDLEEADVTGQHDNLEEIKRKAARLEQREAEAATKATEDKKKADEEAAKVRAATIRNAIFLLIGGAITLGFNALAHALLK